MGLDEKAVEPALENGRLVPAEMYSEGIFQIF
jgi:hypothetical protein